MDGRDIEVLYATEKAKVAESLVADRENWAVETVRAVETVKERHSPTEFDCFVTEYDLPGGNGLDLLEWVRGADPDLPVILHARAGSEAVASEAISAGVTDYLREDDEERLRLVLQRRVENAVKQYRLEQELAESRQRLSLFVEQSPLGVIEWNRDGKAVRVNTAAREILGYDNAELLGEHWETIIADEEVPTVRNRLAELDTDGTGFRHVNENVTRDGERIVCEWHNQVVTDENGEVIGSYSQFQEVTDREFRKEAIANLHDIVDELAACESRQAVLEQTVDAAGRVLEFDRAAVAVEDGGLLEVRAMSNELALQDHPTLPADEGIAGKTYQQERAILVEDVAESDEAKPQSGDMRSALSVPVHDIGVFQAVETVPGAFDQQDLELAKLLVQHTETALERLARERELRDQNERLEQFTDVVSHDLRNPLQVASNWLELAREDCDSEYLDNIEQAHDRMSMLLEQLLRLAKDGDEAVDTENIDIDTCSDRCWQNVDTGEATLVVDVTATLDAERSRFQQLLENLFRNAVEHGQRDGVVTVGALDDGFFVADDGPGIPVDERESVFETGYSTDGQGTGFGLSIVEEVVEAHGWTVSVTDSESGGARFEITGVDFETVEE
jgi:PAS domain S-box-containing protein